jgi:hypothetical protein
MVGHPERAGAASALLGLLQFTVGGVLAPIVGAMGTTTLVPLAAAMAGCLLVAMGLQTSTPIRIRWRGRGLPTLRLRVVERGLWHALDRT